MNTRIDSEPRGTTAPVPAQSIRKPTNAPLGQILVDMGEISSGDMIKAVAMRGREDARIGDILLANGMVSQTGLYRGLAQQFRCDIADLADHPPDTRLLDQIGADYCLTHAIVPWKRVGAMTVVATCRPEEFATISSRLQVEFGQVMFVLAPENEILDAILRYRQRFLADRAETRIAAHESCRGKNAAIVSRTVAALLITLIALSIAFPNGTLLFLCFWAIATLVLNSSLKFAAAWATFRSARSGKMAFSTRRKTGPEMRLPKISVLVPLYREKEIAGRLIRRLSRLRYPRELLDVCLILEQDDAVTKQALKAASVPVWMRQIVVPRAALKTKPRAMNFALDYCKGSIIGVYDAEDAPEPDQLFKVARRFNERGPEVACLQGVLDFYNSQQNWLSRCFTIEYATWFRVVLPGLERLGLIVPLGGTTLFFRRAALEEIGGWDAHNVTEDADLGVRLARRGYRTELLPTVTDEEANCHAWSWIRQRSRWLKGYAMTWAVHTRSPRKLIAQVGWRKFLGVQILFFGVLSQFLLAPLMWSFWALPLGLAHPMRDLLPGPAFMAIVVLFFSAEAISMTVAVLALSPGRHRRLWMWVPTMHLYFPLGTIAAYKAVWELIANPFYWDKTPHGLASSEMSEKITSNQA